MATPDIRTDILVRYSAKSVFDASPKFIAFNKDFRSMSYSPRAEK